MYVRKYRKAKKQSSFVEKKKTNMPLNQYFAACNCDPTGTKRDENGTLICDAIGGQCQCKQLVIGQRCDRCAPGSFRFGQNGCTGKSNPRLWGKKKRNKKKKKLCSGMKRVKTHPSRSHQKTL